LSVNRQDFSGELSRAKRVPWRLYLIVFALHVLAVMSLNAVLTFNRLAAQAQVAFDVAVLPSDVVKPNESKPQPQPQNKLEKPADEAPASQPLPSEPAPIALPEPVMSPLATTMPTVAALHEATSASANHLLNNMRAVTPPAVQLRYSVTKDTDSARATLIWQPHLSGVAKGEQDGYEMSYEATYFGFSIIKQVSHGRLTASGLAPVRFSERRRGRSEQATHFEREKSSIVFSNNRPAAKLVHGAQDRASFLIQLASLMAGQPDQFKTGLVFELPVASVDESEMWAFEVQATETLSLPIGETQAIKVLRRPRRAFDPTVEVWFAPSLSYLPVRIRLTDSGGITDSQLSSKD
jgi:Protein of unknown function (DUF3108)